MNPKKSDYSSRQPNFFLEEDKGFLYVGIFPLFYTSDQTRPGTNTTVILKLLPEF